MNWTDYLIIAITLLSAVAGAWRGLLREAIALITWILATFIAWHFASDLEPSLGGALASAAVRPWAARTILFLVVLVIGTIVGSVIAHFVRLSLFSGMDRLLGFLFGLLRGVVVVGLLTILGHAVQLQGEAWWRHSTLAPYAEGAANVLRTLAGDSTDTISGLKPS